MLGRVSGLLTEHRRSDSQTRRDVRTRPFGAAASAEWLRRAAGRSAWPVPFDHALNHASQAHFGASVGYIGQGGTIPLMNMLSAGFPKAQMMVCGVLGPKSNAHGPNEFLHLPYAQKLTAAVAQVMARMP